MREENWIVIRHFGSNTLCHVKENVSQVFYTRKTDNQILRTQKKKKMLATTRTQALYFP